MGFTPDAVPRQDRGPSTEPQAVPAALSELTRPWSDQEYGRHSGLASTDYRRRVDVVLPMEDPGGDNEVHPIPTTVTLETNMFGVRISGLGMGDTISVSGDISEGVPKAVALLNDRLTELGWVDPGPLPSELTTLIQVEPKNSDRSTTFRSSHPDYGQASMEASSTVTGNDVSCRITVVELQSDPVKGAEPIEYFSIARGPKPTPAWADHVNPDPNFAKLSERAVANAFGEMRHAGFMTENASA